MLSVPRRQGGDSALSKRNLHSVGEFDKVAHLNSVKSITAKANLSITGLSKRFGGRTQAVAIDDLDLEVEPGEFLVLLGPSGCGKTTTLRCIAGLESGDTGRIAFGDRPVFDASARINVPPNKRNIGMVFQTYALWPHMRVRDNIGYPLRARRVEKATAKEWIAAVAELVDCSELLDRYPAQLSGGQQQRIALARGLVARPDLVLFDEPLSNLDARLRDQVRTEIHELHRHLGFTAVYVTHDQTEALALGDRLAIMRAGAIEQLGAPEEIFEEPRTEYVAGFIGMGNRLTLARHGTTWEHDGVPVDGDVEGVLPERITIRARNEDIVLTPPDEVVEPQTLSCAATVVDSEFAGRAMDVVVTVGETRLQSRIPAGKPGGWARTLEPGQPVQAAFRAAHLAFFDTDGVRIPVSSGDRPVVAV
jgi:iron(III) transport system ATP-binding protein